MSFAKIPDGSIHPESVFSVARRYHLLELYQADEGKTVFEDIESLSPEEFKKAAGIIVRQNHFVTQQCQASLSPAKHLAKSAKPLVEEFLREENGHDVILGAALKSMNLKALDVPVSRQSKCLMQLLKFSAQTNFLSFAIVVDFFERNTYEDIDPIATLLLKGGFEKAANQVDRHKQINDAGGHENVACGFLEKMNYCDPEYVTEALRIAEMVSLVMNSVSGSAWELYSETRSNL